MGTLPVAWRRRIVAVSLVLLLFASQLLASVQSPWASTTSTGSVVGRATYAYLGGLRKFAAAVLWNRIEPLFHEYYSEVPLSQQVYVLPTLYMVTVLDPQFTGAYYVASWVVSKNQGPDAGIALARTGVSNNPDAGLLHANLAQLLVLRGDHADLPEIGALAERIVSADVVWFDEEERFEGFAIARDAFSLSGDAAAALAIDEELEAMRAQGTGLGDHDHDGDGKQDH